MYSKRKSLRRIIGILPLTLIVILCLTSCRGALKNIFTPATFESDCLELRNQIEREDYKLLVKYVKEHKSELSSKKDLTYGEILTNAKADEQKVIEEINELADRFDKMAKSNSPDQVLDIKSKSGDMLAVELVLKKFSKAFYRGDVAKMQTMYSESHRAEFEGYVQQAKNISQEDFYKLNIVDASSLVKVKNEF